jgi:hypothetical protein
VALAFTATSPPPVSPAGCINTSAQLTPPSVEMAQLFSQFAVSPLPTLTM